MRPGSIKTVRRVRSAFHSSCLNLMNAAGRRHRMRHAVDEVGCEMGCHRYREVHVEAEQVLGQNVATRIDIRHERGRSIASGGIRNSVSRDGSPLRRVRTT